MTIKFTTPNLYDKKTIYTATFDESSLIPNEDGDGLYRASCTIEPSVNSWFIYFSENNPYTAIKICTIRTHHFIDIAVIDYKDSPVDNSHLIKKEAD